MLLSNFIETTLGSVTKETSQYTKSLKKKIEDKKIENVLLQKEKMKNRDNVHVGFMIEKVLISLIILEISLIRCNQSYLAK